MGRLAINAKLYIRSGGTYNSPVWTECDLLSDVKVDAAWDEGEANARYSRVKLAMKSLLGLQVTAKLLKTPLNGQYETLMSYALKDDLVDTLVMDGSYNVEGNRGWRFDASVFSLSEDQALANVLYDELTFKPSPSDNPPKAVKVASGGTLTYALPGVNGDSFS